MVPPDLPLFYTPAQIAGHFGISERTVRSDARANGCCRAVGNRLFLTEQDLAALLEVWRVAPTAVASRPSSGNYPTLLKLRSDTTAQAIDLLKKRSKGRAR